jgi:hypothetical protein
MDPAPPTSDAALKRGRKRTAPVAEQPEEVYDSEDDEQTPRKPGVPTDVPEVLVNSPPTSRPKQRIRKNEAGDAVDVIPEPSAKPWVGTGDVSLSYSFAYSYQLTHHLGPMCRVFQTRIKDL